MIQLSSLSFDTDSAELDRSLGFHVHTIEQRLLEQAKLLQPQGNHHTWGEGLHKGNQSWVGLDPETLQTPYSELKEMCQLLAPKSGQLVIDLGAGYGRLALIIETLYPGVLFNGFELVGERVEEGKRLFKLLNFQYSTLDEQDLTSDDFNLPEADIYFLYDYGKVSHIRHTLNQLGDLVGKRTFRLVARGKGIRSLINLEFPWLSPEAGHERTHFSIYSV